MYLRAHPLCVQCLGRGRVTMATEVHHIVKLRDGGHDADDNLMALCHACHSAITAAGG
jgi:5-methylcytosine-specific restriction protein A